MVFSVDALPPAETVIGVVQIDVFEAELFRQQLFAELLNEEGYLVGDACQNLVLLAGQRLLTIFDSGEVVEHGFELGQRWFVGVEPEILADVFQWVSA